MRRWSPRRTSTCARSTASMNVPHSEHSTFQLGGMSGIRGPASALAMLSTLGPVDPAHDLVEGTISRYTPLSTTCRDDPPRLAATRVRHRDGDGRTWVAWLQRPRRWRLRRSCLLGGRGRFEDNVSPSPGGGWERLFGCIVSSHSGSIAPSLAGRGDAAAPPSSARWLALQRGG